MHNEDDGYKILTGEPVSITTSSLDIMDESQGNYYRTIVDQLKVGIIVFQGKPPKITFANNAMTNITGYSNEELLSFSFHDIATRIFPEDREFVLQRLSRRLEGESVQNQYVFRGIQKDGSVVRVALFATLIEYQGAPAVLASFVDTTDNMHVKDAVSEGEERFRNLIEFNPMGIHMYKLELDDRLIFIGANPSADRLLGVDNRIFIGKTIEDAFPQSIYTELPDRYREVALSGIPWSTEQIEYKDDRIEGAYEVHAFQIGPRLMAASFLDVTERKKAEKELRRSEKMHRTIVESMHDLVFVYDKNNCYSMYFVSTENLLYAQSEKFIGKHLSDVLPHDVAYSFIVRTRRVRDTGIPETFDYPLQIDGKFYWFSATLSLHDDSESIVAVVRDISKRKLAEESVHHQRDFLERVIESLTHPFYVIDAFDYSIQVANTATKFGKINGSQTCYNMTHQRNTPCDGSNHPCPLEEVKRTKKPAIVEHAHYDESGNIRFHRVQGYPIFDTDGNVVQMIEYNLDITEQRVVEKQLECESKRARLYLDLLAHDMANQLQIISGRIELIQAFSIKQKIENVSNFLEEIENSIRRCMSTITKARVSERISISPLVKRSLLGVLLECIDFLSINNVVDVEVEADIDDGYISADNFLEQLLTNLLENAIIHNTLEMKHVWIDLSKKGNGYELSIADNGPGIDNRIKLNLFNPDHRFGGLGLHISAEIVEKYGGFLTVYDRIEGKSELGVKFVVWFPEWRESIK